MQVFLQEMINLRANKNFIATIKEFFNNLFKRKETQENNNNFISVETSTNFHEQNWPEPPKDKPKPQSLDEYMRNNDMACI